jgi:hypothetical protein
MSSVNSSLFQLGKTLPLPKTTTPAAAAEEDGKSKRKK